MKEETTEQMSEVQKSMNLTSPMTGYDQHTSPFLIVTLILIKTV
jgi:hypothetical protein